jgi:hypothetical protein
MMTVYTILKWHVNLLSSSFLGACELIHVVACKGKGKGYPITGHKDPEVV